MATATAPWRQDVWIIAIVLAGVSFLGYAAVKYFGAQHGLLLAAAAGALVFNRRNRRQRASRCRG